MVLVVVLLLVLVAFSLTLPEIIVLYFVLVSVLDSVPSGKILIFIVFLMFTGDLFPLRVGPSSEHVFVVFVVF